MYIEFVLPAGAGGAAAGIALRHIIKDIDQWASKYNITDYRTKIHKYTYRLCLRDDEEYQFFMLSWNPQFLASNNFNLKNPNQLK